MILRKIPAKTHAQILFPGCLRGQLPRSSREDRVPDDGTGEGATARPAVQVAECPGRAREIYFWPAYHGLWCTYHTF